MKNHNLQLVANFKAKILWYISNYYIHYKNKINK